MNVRIGIECKTSIEIEQCPRIKSLGSTFNVLTAKRKLVFQQNILGVFIALLLAEELLTVVWN